MSPVVVDRVESVYRIEHPRLWRALVSFTGDTDVASDAESETFTQALRRGEAIEDVRAWVWRSAFLIAKGMLAERRPDGGAPDHVAETAGSLAEFLALLQDLSDQQRACVVLRYVGGFRAGEIAKLLGTTANTVRVQLNRAHTSLRTSLREDDDG